MIAEALAAHSGSGVPIHFPGPTKLAAGSAVAGPTSFVMSHDFLSHQASWTYSTPCFRPGISDSRQFSQPIRSICPLVAAASPSSKNSISRTNLGP
jgi:hypothetical protein